jgi:hypothetical protein
MNARFATAQLKKICSRLIVSQIQDVAAIYNLVDDQQT